MQIIKSIHSNKGLTLIEIAIVLIVLGILIGLGASIIGPLTKRIKRRGG
jgi:prepilin-type N-terminal cleavage/methylation domain-containing protein